MNKPRFTYLVRAKSPSAKYPFIYAHRCDRVTPPFVFMRPGELDEAARRFDTLDEALYLYALGVSGGSQDVRIIRVAPDGTETPLPTFREALGELALIADILAHVPGVEAHGPGEMLSARVGRALDDVDIPGEEQAKIATVANREWWRANNTTVGSEADRLGAASAASMSSTAAENAAYRADRLEKTGGVL